MKNTLRFLVIGLTFLFTSIAVNGATFIVNTTNDTADASPGDGICADAVNACSLRAAISEANALAGDDIITLPSGAYTQTLIATNEDANAGGDFDIAGNLSINGADSATTFIQANVAAGTATERVLNIRSGIVAINNVTIRNGRFAGAINASTQGAGIANLGTLTLNNVIVRDNRLNATSGSPNGAGIYNTGAAVILNNTTITANSTSANGSAGAGGMASFVTATITITNSSISGNTATSGGGQAISAGLSLQGVVTVNATNSQFNNNVGTGPAGSNGVGLRIVSSLGAAVFNATDCSFSGNIGTTTGAFNSGVGMQLSVNGSASLTMTLDRVTINDNKGNDQGIGINASGGNITLNVRNSTISNNTGASDGGGVFIINEDVPDTATSTYNFLNSTISGNTSESRGGGVYIERASAAALNANFNFTTIANNSSASGGGLSHISTAAVNLKNSIVADNIATTGSDMSGTFNSQDYNHLENLSGATITGTTTNNSTGDPQLGMLADNGGTTRTHLPNAGSPVINTIPNGTNDCGTIVSTDQRGIVRPASGACEKGSVELGVITSPAVIRGTVTNANGNGIRNATVTLSGCGLSQPVILQTGSFGTYSFNNGVIGQSCTITVSANRFTFTPNSQTITIFGDTTVNFTANSGFGVRSVNEVKTKN